MVGRRRHLYVRPGLPRSGRLDGPYFGPGVYHLPMLHVHGDLKMADIWFISDTHFFHSNILKFLGDDGLPFRRFSSIEAMNEEIVDNWNKVVKPQDHVYHLGDVTFRYDRPFAELMSRLKGQKRLVIGNHDKLKNQALLKWFDKVMLWRGFKEFNFTAVHIPLELRRLRDGQFCVYGHIHQNLEPDPHYINLCVEHTNYAPVHIEDVRKMIKERS